MGFHRSEEIDPRYRIMVPEEFVKTEAGDGA